MGFRGGGGQIDPPSESWFSSTPAGIGLRGSIAGIEKFKEEKIHLGVKNTFRSIF